MYERWARYIAAAIITMFWAVSAPAQDLVSRYVAGQDYQVVDSPASATRDGKIRVREYFLYSCPHCYHFESTLNAWRDRHPDVAFSRVPVLFGDAGQTYARLYYAEVRLGVVDRLHDSIFDAIHQQGRPLATRAAMHQFMVNHGVDGSRFDAAYESDEVADKMRDVEQTMRHFRITAVPSISVAGRYWVSGRSAGSNERMLEIVDYLIDQARQADSSAKTGS